MMISSGLLDSGRRSDRDLRLLTFDLAFNQVEIPIPPAQEYRQAVGIGVAEHQIVGPAVAGAVHLHDRLVERHALPPVAFVIDTIDLSPQLVRLFPPRCGLGYPLVLAL